MVIRMEFCPKCGGMFVPKKEEGEEVKLVCHNCGHTANPDEVKGYKLVSKTKTEDAEPTVLEGKEQATLPTTKTKCPKCSHNKAYWWMSQTRGADEPTTRFYKCIECNHTWREY